MEIDIDRVISTYAIDMQSNYKNFSVIIRELLTSILKSKDITPHSITSREKSPSSLKEKIQRDSKNYDNPLKEITDLAGVRIITYFSEDVDKIIPLIEKEFKIDKDNSVDKRKKTDPSTFGYVSVHLVVELSDERKKLPEYSSYVDMKCEIQVRTILQHAWAEIEHDIVYKSNEEIPFELRHRFASLAGLLEVADREFEQLRKEEIRVREEIRKSIINEQYELPVNRDSLLLYLSKIRNEENVVLKHKDKRNLKSSNSRISELINMLKYLEITTIQQFHKLLTESALEDARQKLDKIKMNCPRMDLCLLKYFIAIGETKGLDKSIIAKYSDCPGVNEIYDIKTEKNNSPKRKEKPETKRNTPHNK